MSALLQEADLCGAPVHFRFGPKPDIVFPFDAPTTALSVAKSVGLRTSRSRQRGQR